MTELAEAAFAAVGRLSPADQDEIAIRIHEELFRNVEQAEPVVQYTPDAEPTKADWP